MTDDLYARLGIAGDVPRSSITEAEIKQAYRHLAMQHHPDREGGDAEKFKAIQEAYEVLSDPLRRAEYDANGTVAPPAAIKRDRANKDLALLFAEMLNHGGPFDIVKRACITLAQRRAEADRGILKNEELQRKLRRDRDLVRVKKEGEPNAYHTMIDANLEETARNVLAAKERKADLEYLSQILAEEYEDAPPAPTEDASQPKQIGTSIKDLNRFHSEFYGSQEKPRW